MALNIAEKKQVVEELRALAQGSVSLITAEYRGLTSVEMTKLRGDARRNNVNLVVAPNNLASRAFADGEFACIDDKLVGPIVLAFSREDPADAARLFKSFIKESEKLIVTSIALSGKVVSGSDLEKIANLPTKQQALGLLVSALQAPLTKFVRTLAEPYAKFIRTLAAVRDKKERE